MRSTGEPYRGINVLLLWGASLERGYSCNRCFTFNQAKAAGAHVRRGEQGSMVIYAGQFEQKDDTEEDGTHDQRKTGGMFLRAYTVFNAEQLDGLEPSAEQETGPALAGEVQGFFNRVGARVLHGGDRAYYMLSADVMQLPPVTAFKDTSAYCATRAHELIHWTGHSSRLAREFGQRFGDEAYAFEELVAELGAAFVCADMGLATEPREDHAAYLQHWLAVLRLDKRAIFTAASHAQRAADFLMQRGGEHA